jgi:hypothetical protein
MFVRSRVPARRANRLGDTQTTRNILDAVLPDWWLNWFGGPINTPLSQEERTDIANAQVRASGIDPGTNKIMPPYAQAVQQKYNVDPNDPAAVKALADRIRADQLQYLDNVFKRLTQPPPGAAGMPWGTIALVGGALFLGTAVFVKIAK